MTSKDEVHEFICETCGRKDTVTSEAAFEAGWDYPPFIGAWGVVSPRTCPDCPMDSTAWWAIAVDGKTDFKDLLPRHQATVERIMQETKKQ